jgi:hypothetical protein
VNFKHKIVITQHQPWRNRALIVGIVATLLLSAFGLYRYTRATTVSDFERAQSERDSLLDERRTLTRELRSAKSENESLKNQVAYLGRSQEIDGAACSSVKQSLGQLQAEASDLREQLAFYRGIVSPQESQAGVRVYDFKVSKSKTETDGYHYDLVLIQPVRSEKRVAGSIDILIEGLKAGQKQTLRFAEISADSNKNLVFSFKYFEEFGGQVRLPAGFRPLRATVALQPSGETGPKIEDEYEWAKILQEAAAP